MAVWEAPGPPSACPGGEGARGEAILLLHGVPLASRTWKEVTPLLAERGYRVTAADLLGMGESDKPLAFSYSLASLTDLAADLMDHLTAGGGDRWVVVGHDLGGLLALRLAARKPELVVGAVALDATVSLRYPFPWLNLFASRPSFLAGVFRLGQPAGMRGTLRALWRRSGQPPEELVESGAQGFSRPEAVWTLARIVEGIGGTPEEEVEAVREELAGLRRPVLLVRGRDDPSLPLEALTDLASLIPDARWEEIPEAGHLSPLEQPERVAGLIAAFASRLAAPAPDEDDCPAPPPEDGVE